MYIQKFKIQSLLLILTLLSVKVSSDLTYQCQTGSTVTQNNYDIQQTSGLIDQLQEFESVQTILDSDEKGPFYSKALFYLVQNNSDSSKDTIRQKLIRGDGTIVQVPDLVLSGGITFFEMKSNEGIAITDDMKIHYLQIYEGKIQESYTFDILTQIQQIGSSTITNEANLVALRFSDFQIFDSFKVIFKQSGIQGKLHFIQVAYDGVTYKHSLSLSDSDIQTSFNDLIFHPSSGKFYQGTQQKSLTQINIFGNQMLYPISYIHLYDSRIYSRELVGVWNFDTTLFQTNIFLYWVPSVDQVIALRTLNTDKFPTKANIKQYFSSLNSFLIQYDNQHLRYTTYLGYNYELVSYTTTLDDTVQQIIAGGVALNFAFGDIKTMIQTDSSIHVISLIPSQYGKDNTEVPLTSVNSGSQTYFVNDNLVWGDHLQLQSQIILGDNIKKWFDDLDSNFIVARTRCSCSEKGVKHMECFENSVCIFVAGNFIVDCTDPEIITKYFQYYDQYDQQDQC